MAGEGGITADQGHPAWPASTTPRVPRRLSHRRPDRAEPAAASDRRAVRGFEAEEEK